MNGFVADCRHALRLYARTPGASLIAIAVLAIGMAFVSAFVSLYVDLVLRPHPGFEQSSRIVTYGFEGAAAGRLPRDLIERVADESTTLEAAAGIASESFLVGPNAQAMTGELVTREFFAGLRPRLALGRGFEPSEHQAEGEPVVVISYGYWQRQLDGRGDVLGGTIEIRGPAGPVTSSPADETEGEVPTDFRIVGVMGAGYVGIMPPQTNNDAQFWIPAEQGIPIVLGRYPAQMRAMIPSSFSMLGVARRAPGASARAVASELNARYLEEYAEAAEAFPGSEGISNIRFGALDGLVFDPNIQRDAQRQLRLFLAASVLLALVAAANVSLFLLARAPGRRRELGIRLSVGAPLKRIARQLMTEAGLLVVVSAVLGLAFSIWLAEFLSGLEFLRQAEWRNVTVLDWRVLVIVGVLLALLMLLVSVAPIVGLKKLGIAASSRQVSARAGLAQRIAGTAQIAVAATLGGAGVAFAWYLGSLMLGYPGYETRDLHVVRHSVDVESYYDASVEDRFNRFIVDQSRQREVIASLPGVTGVSLASAVPGIERGLFTARLQDPDDPTAQLIFEMMTIDTGYIDLLGLRLVHGRASRPRPSCASSSSVSSRPARSSSLDAALSRRGGPARICDSGIARRGTRGARTARAPAGPRARNSRAPAWSAVRLHSRRVAQE